jgi:hypothetical protein
MLPSRYTQAVMAGESKYTAYIDHVIVKVHQFKKYYLNIVDLNYVYILLFTVYMQ